MHPDFNGWQSIKISFSGRVRNPAIIVESYEKAEFEVNTPSKILYLDETCIVIDTDK